MSSSASNAGSSSPRGSARYVAPDFKRRQLLFDAFTKLGAGGAQQGGGQKAISDSAHGGHSADEIGPKGTLLYTWGAGYHGQLGLNTFRKKCRMMPACIDFREPVLVVACGGFHTAVLTDDGRVFSWGDGRYGQLGNLARKHNMHSTPHLVDAWGASVSGRVLITALACGQYHTAAISNMGKLWTWGSGKWGQLGHGMKVDERFPKRIEAEKTGQRLGNFTQVACGDRHTVVVNDEGKVVTFGSGQHGQLGHGNGNDALKPQVISEGPLAEQFVVSIDAGATTTAAVTNTGLLYLWGFGESIHPKGCSNIQDSPRLVKMREPVKQVACGQAHVLVLTDAGDVYSFGMASMGQLGHGSRSNVRNPRLVLRGKEIHQIDAGRYHSMAVTAYGVLYSWGCGESGQLGHNSLETELFPKLVENILPSVVGQISCGEHHSFALTSISHSSVSADVLNWKLIEDEELKLKRAMLHDVPNGLKSKHILQVEQERKGIIRQLAEALKKEREENGSHAQLQMSLIRQPEELVEDVRTVQEDLLNKSDPDAVAQVNAMASAAAKLMLTSERQNVSSARDHSSALPAASASAGEHSAMPSQRGPILSMHPSSHAAEEEEDEDGDVEGANGQRKKKMGVSASAATLPSGSASGQRTLSSVASSPDFYPEEEHKQNTGLKAPKLSQGGPRPSTVDPSLSASTSSPSLRVSKQLAPLRPSTALTVALHHSQKHKAKHDLSRTEQLDSHQMAQPDSPSHEHAQAHTQAMVDYNPGVSVLGGTVPAGSFQPLAPRMAFAEQTVKALTWVKNMVAVAPDSASMVNYNVLRLQKQYNQLKAARDVRQNHLASIKGQLALTKPSAEEEEVSKVNAERIKQLNMKLVTLTTRLMEAEENKRNYELYIIRMKEEDLQLSKQIEHLRQLVTEYDRLLSKVERMSSRVQGQKGEVAAELQQFQTDIQNFVHFADQTVQNYRAVLHANFKKSQKADAALEKKMDANYVRSRSTLTKLEGQLSSAEQTALEQKEKLDSWEDKVEFYEKRFRKLSNSTGLSRSEQIIAKHYFNSEITSDLKLDIEFKQDTLLALQKQQKDLESVLSDLSSKHTDSRWRDVAGLEEANVNAVNRLLRAKGDSELWAQKVTLVEEGLLQLARSVQSTLAKKEGLTPEQQAQLVLIGSNPSLSSPSPAADGAFDPSRTLGGHLIPAPEKGLRAVDLEKAVESQLTILMDACEKEKAEQAERERSAAEEASRKVPSAKPSARKSARRGEGEQEAAESAPVVAEEEAASPAPEAEPAAAE